MNDLVNIVLSDQQTFQQVSPLLSLPQIVPGAPGQNLHLEPEVLVQDLPQGQDPRLLLVVHQRQHDH